MVDCQIQVDGAAVGLSWLRLVCFVRHSSGNACTWSPGTIVSDVFGAESGEVKNIFGNTGGSLARIRPGFSGFEMIFRAASQGATSPHFRRSGPVEYLEIAIAKPIA